MSIHIFLNVNITRQIQQNKFELIWMYIYFTIFSENHEHASITKHPLLDSTVYLAPSVKHKAEGERGRSAGRKHAAVLQHMEWRGEEALEDA